MKKQQLFITFAICIIVSALFFVFEQRNSSSTFGMIFQLIYSPMQRVSLHSFHAVQQKSLVDQLKEENMKLETQLAKQQLILQDNNALRDQFQVTNPSPKTLLPAAIIGMPSFFPGVSFPEEIILDKGNKDGVKNGNVVIFKDNLIGLITKTNEYFSLVVVVGNKSTSLTAKTSKSSALGVIKGEGNGQMLLDNVVLSDTLQVGDLVVTSGETSLSGQGYPPGLVFGKITSIEKNPTALFQKADVESLIDITRIPIVFIVIGEK